MYSDVQEWMQHLSLALTVKSLRKAAPSVKSGASPGGGGTRAEYWVALFENTAVAQAMVLILRQLCTKGASPYLPDQASAYLEIRQTLMRCAPGAMSKPKKECDCPGGGCVGNHPREVNCEKSLSKIISKAGLGAATTKALRTRTKSVCTLANPGGCNASAMHTQIFQDATVYDARAIPQ